MSRKKELAKNTLIISIGTICTKLITFLLLPLYTGILNTDEYGIVDLFNTLIFLLLPIITFQIEQAVFRELIEHRKDEEKKKTIISSSVITIIFQCICFVLLFIPISFFINNQYKTLLLLNIVVHVFSSIFLQISRGLRNKKKYAIGSFISALFTIIFNIVFLVLCDLRVSGMLLGTILGQTICCLYLFVFLKLYRFIGIKYFDKKMVKSLLKYSIPLIPNAICWWIFQSSDRAIVSGILGLSMTGILAAASKFSGIYTTMYNVFDRSWFESITLHYHDSDIESYFNRTFNMMLKLFLGIDIILISIMPFVYPIMINKKFSLGYVLVPILLISCFFNVIQGMIAVIYAANKDTKSIAKTSSAAALINIIIHFALIKTTGLYAAALSTLGAFVIISVYRIFDIRKKYLKIVIDKEVTVIGLLSLLLILPLYYLNNMYLNLISVLISLTICVTVNKEFLLDIKKNIKNIIKRRVI